MLYVYEVLLLIKFQLALQGEYCSMQSSCHASLFPIARGSSYDGKQEDANHNELGRSFLVEFLGLLKWLLLNPWSLSRLREPSTHPV